MQRAAKDEITGTQTLGRAVAILKELSAAGAGGLRLIDLQQALGLTRPTAHRMLSALSHYGLIVREAAGRRYMLGPELALLGHAAASQKLDLQKLCQDHVAELARETGDSAFLMSRSGYELVCVDLRTGSYPIKTMTAEIGTRRPLGAGASGIAVLAELDSAEIDRVLHSCRAALRNFGNTSVGTIRTAVHFSRRNGYALSDGMVLKSVRGLSVSIVNGGDPIGALCVASIRERLTEERIPSIVAMLRREKAHIERKLEQITSPRAKKRTV